MDLDTIVARATPDGEGGLAVVRVSGSQAFAVAARVFRGGGFSTGSPRPRRAVYGILHEPVDGEPVAENELDVIDRAIALPLPAPGSYTGEDTVEFFCHGGRLVAAAVVAACEVAGAAPAPPGEFTRRAFLNGKLTLDQAEAVADLIQAESRHAARAAVGQLRGGLDNELASIEAPLLALLAEVEGSLEFTAEEVAGPNNDEIGERLNAAVADCERLLALAPAGRLLRDGVHVVLAGKPNVGKSSLFNLLLDDDRALVDDEAGTTRDVVTARVRRGDGLFVLHDTAGLRADAGRVEQLGIERTWRMVREADIVLSLREAPAGRPNESATAGFPATDLPEPDLPATDAVVIEVITKADRGEPAAPPALTIVTSSRDGRGGDELWVAIERAAADFGLREAVGLGVVLNERHRHRLCASRDELARLRDTVRRADPGHEVVGTLLASILAGLGEISGRVFSEQLLEGVFRRFCVGK